MTHVDVLTGLPQRTEFETDLAALTSAEAAVSLAILDVNAFFDINRTFGHETGDAVLATLAAVIADNAVGRTYRVAGDEFAIVMPDMSLEQAFLSMENLRRMVQESTDRFALPDARAVTVGIGVAQYPRDAKDAEALHRAASAALGSCKEAGASQVMLPLNEEMVMKSCYYAASSVRRLKSLSERTGKKESMLLREALSDLLRKYDTR